MHKRRSAFTLLLAVTAGLLAATVFAGGASARTPCWKQVLNDWSNGRPIGTYPLHCYRDAIRNLPEDLRDYSSAADDINAALQAQIAQRNTRSPQSVSGSAKDKGVPRGIGGADQPSRSAYRRAIDNLGTSNADALPIPLLVLASLGGALLAAAAGMTATKRIRALRARRGPPDG